MEAPKKIRMIYNNGKYNGCKGKDYYEILKVKNGEPVFEIWCSMWCGGKRNGERRYKLAWRETLTKKWVNSDVRMSVMTGYQMTFMSSYYEERNVMIETTGTMPDFSHGLYTSYMIGWSEKDIRKCKDFKYIKDDVLKDIGRRYKFELMKMLRVWKEYPKAEYLINNRLAYMTLNSRFLKIKDKNWDKWIMKNKNYLAQNEPDYKYCRRAFNLGMTCEGLYIYDNLRDNANTELVNYLIDQCGKYKEQINYINASNLYRDYIDALKILNVNENTKPANLYEAHEKWTKKLNKHNSKALNKKLNEISTNIENSLKKKISLEGLNIKLCHSAKDFQTLGTKLHNCVARNDYDKKMAKGECLIFGIWKDNKPIECVEIGLEDKPTIKQCYGDHNQVSEYHNSCMEMCKSFIRTKAIRQLTI